MPSRLDDLDRRIVSLLLEDGRMPCSEMARRLGGVSERTVRYRIDRLLAEDVIHIGAVVNPRAVGYAVTADVWIEVAAGRQRDVAERLAELPQVSYVAYSTGDRDLSIQVYARDNQELHRLVSEVVGRVPGVTRTGVMLVPWKVKDVHRWAIPQDPPVGLRQNRRNHRPAEGQRVERKGGNA